MLPLLSSVNRGHLYLTLNMNLLTRAVKINGARLIHFGPTMSKCSQFINRQLDPSNSLICKDCNGCSKDFQKFKENCRVGRGVLFGYLSVFVTIIALALPYSFEERKDGKLEKMDRLTRMQYTNPACP